MNEWLLVAMKQITGPVGLPHVFFLVGTEDGLWLNHNGAEPGKQWRPGDEFLFRLRKSKT